MNRLLILLYCISINPLLFSMSYELLPLLEQQRQVPFLEQWKNAIEEGNECAFSGLHKALLEQKMTEAFDIPAGSQFITVSCDQDNCSRYAITPAGNARLQELLTQPETAQKAYDQIADFEQLIKKVNSISNRFFREAAPYDTIRVALTLVAALGALTVPFFIADSYPGSINAIPLYGIPSGAVFTTAGATFYCNRHIPQNRMRQKLEGLSRCMYSIKHRYQEEYFAQYKIYREPKV